MLKHVLLASAAALALTAVSFATPPTPSTGPSATFTIFGELGGVCSITNDNTGYPYNMDSLNLNDDGTLQGGDHAVDTVFKGSAWCNGPGSTVTVTATPLVNTDYTTPPAGFTNRIDYQLTTALVSGTLDTATVGGKLEDTNAGPFSGPLGAFTITTDPTLLKVLAGGYYGSVTITVQGAGL